MVQPLSDPGYFIGWGTLSLINAGLAQTKNRNGSLWIVVSERLDFSDGYLGIARDINP